MHSKRTGKWKYEYGSTSFEGVAAIVILFLVLFSMLQIYRWCMTRQFCQYSAYYTAKGMSLGYDHNLAIRAARVAAIAVSGQPRGGFAQDEASASRYMTHGDASGVGYEYWFPSSQNQPYLRISGSYSGDDVRGTVTLRNEPLIASRFLKMIFGDLDYDPKSTVRSHNYSNVYMED